VNGYRGKTFVPIMSSDAMPGRLSVKSTKTGQIRIHYLDRSKKEESEQSFGSA
jgi:hypothetical protein